MSRPTFGQGLQEAMRARFAQAEWLSSELARARAGLRLDRHPFLRRWLDGRLGPAELQLFAAEQHHAALALEQTARRAAAMTDGLLGEQLAGYALDRGELVGHSLKFAVATGWGRASWYFAEDPLGQTLACASAWGCEGRSLARHLVTIHALESTFAELAPRLREALKVRYGFDEPALRYFGLHAERSETHADVALAALTSLLPLLSPIALVRQAELVHRSYLGLLDGVQELGARA